MSDFIIQAEHLTKKFTLDAGFFAKNDRFVYAVNDVSFGIERGKTYGLVGESGCGKTTTARMLVRMYKADGGKIWYRAHPACGGSGFSGLRANRAPLPSATAEAAPTIPCARGEAACGDMEAQNILLYNKTQLRHYREKIKYVFQDPSRSLNPRMTVFNILSASYKYSSIWPGKKIAYD